MCSFLVPETNIGFESKVPKEYPLASRGDFQLPVAFSSDLNTIAVADTIYRLWQESEHDHTTFSLKAQLMPASANGSQYCHGHSCISAASCDDKLQFRPGYTSSCHCYERYHYSFSPNNSYLAILDGDKSRYSWVMTLYEGRDHNSCNPTFTKVVSTEIFLDSLAFLSFQDVPPEGFVRFHPSESLVAFSICTETHIWKFTTQGIHH